MGEVMEWERVNQEKAQNLQKQFDEENMKAGYLKYWIYADGEAFDVMSKDGSIVCTQRI